jgi:hypothetical protein
MTEQVPSKERDIARLRCVFDMSPHRWSRAHAEELFNIIREQQRDFDEKERMLWEKITAARTTAEPPVDGLYVMLVRRGYPQHEADEISRMTARIEAGRPASPPGELRTAALEAAEFLRRYCRQSSGRDLIIADLERATSTKPPEQPAKLLAANCTDCRPLGHATLRPRCSDCPRMGERNDA